MTVIGSIVRGSSGAPSAHILLKRIIIDPPRANQGVMWRTRFIVDTTAKGSVKNAEQVVESQHACCEVVEAG